MQTKTLALLLLGVAFVGCNSETATEPARTTTDVTPVDSAPDPTPEPADPPAAGTGDEAVVSALRAAIATLEASAEHTDETVQVQHILISFKGVRGQTTTRSKEDAEVLTAQLYARIQAGEDFDALVKEHTDDAHPGIYTMTLGKAPSGAYQRTGMVPAFGNVGWRLAVGEVGVAPFDNRKSPYGWHIVKRLE